MCIRDRFRSVHIANLMSWIDLISRCLIFLLRIWYSFALLKIFLKKPRSHRIQDLSFFCTSLPYKILTCFVTSYFSRKVSHFELNIIPIFPTVLSISSFTLLFFSTIHSKIFETFTPSFFCT